jgi:tyrosine-protein kinase Etk/Wzc
VKRPPSIIGTLAESRWIGQPLYRRLFVFVLVAVCAIMTLYPERYRAAVTMTPTDPANLGLSGALNQLGAINSVFGNQAAIEIALKVARGADVRNIAAARSNLAKTKKFDSAIEMDRWLTKKVSIRSLRGGIIQIEVFDRDAEFAKRLVTAFSDATRDRLAEINRKQTAYKRDILIKLVNESGTNFSDLQQAYDSFRLKTLNSEPSVALSSSTDRVESIRTMIKAKEVRLSAARAFATDDNIAVKQILVELQSLRQQLAVALAQNPTVPGSIGGIVQQSTKVRELERRLLIARRLYEGYTRFLEGTAVEDLTSTANVRVLEPPFIDSARQINLIAFAIGVFILLAGMAVEFYQMRPPVGARPRSNRD